ncbi:hypothetical protein [Bradyrhizobium manausense]|nr:hypothetical protein [Bradyrhizobium manausense]
MSVIVDPAYAEADAAISGNKSEIVRSFFVMVRLHHFFEARHVRF